MLVPRSTATQDCPQITQMNTDPRRIYVCVICGGFWVGGWRSEIRNSREGRVGGLRAHRAAEGAGLGQQPTCCIGNSR
jgi:hypothetical protein